MALGIKSVGRAGSQARCASSGFSGDPESSKIARSRLLKKNRPATAQFCLSLWGGSRLTH